MDGLQYDHIAEEIYKNVGKNDIETRQLLAVKRDILNRLNQSIPEAFIESLSEFMNEAGFDDDHGISLIRFKEIFTDWMKANVQGDDADSELVALSQTLNNSVSSLDSEPHILNNSLSNSSGSYQADVFVEPYKMPVPLQRVRKDSFGAAAIRERESNSEYEEQISYGTYSAWGESPRKPLQESQSMNKIPDKTNEVEQVRQQLNQSLMEYDKLLERFEKVEAELKTSKAENEKLERQKNLLRTSNDNLNKELDTMNELRKVFSSEI